MDKTRFKYFLDVGMTSVFILCLGTGLAKFAPVAKVLALKSSVIVPMTIVHDYSGLAFGMFAVAHMALNWKWMVAMTKKVSTTGTAPHNAKKHPAEKPHEAPALTLPAVPAQMKTEEPVTQGL